MPEIHGDKLTSGHGQDGSSHNNSVQYHNSSGIARGVVPSKISSSSSASINSSVILWEKMGQPETNCMKGLSPFLCSLKCSI